MSLDHRFAEIRNALDDARAIRDEMRGSGGGLGGGSGGVEHRVGRLEGEVSSLSKQVTDMRVDSAKSFGEIKATLAAIDERTKHLPTRWEVFLILAAVLGVAGGALAIAARFIG